ncbi:MAG: OmpH family outer membrane protein [Chitinophagaceae bacterium]
MNKIKLFVIASLLIFIAVGAKAQKTGYISLDEVVFLMPEIGKVDTLLNKYRTDSLNREFASLVQDYRYRDSILGSRDTLKMPLSVKQQHQQALQNVAYQVQNWQAISEQAYQAKQSQLVQPLYRKAMNALNEVAKANGYAYVLNKEALLVAPPGDDLLPLVAKKLNIKLPANTATTPKK